MAARTDRKTQKKSKPSVAKRSEPKKAASRSKAPAPKKPKPPATTPRPTPRPAPRPIAKPARKASKAPPPAVKAAGKVAAAPVKSAPRAPEKPSKAARPVKAAPAKAPVATSAKRPAVEPKGGIVSPKPEPGARRPEKGSRRALKPLRPMRQPPLIKHYQFIGVPQFKKSLASEPPPPPKPAPPPEPPPATLEERVERVHKRLAEQTDEFRRSYEERYLMSWIVHDSALEGTVYSIQELDAAIHGTMPVGEESSLQPAVEEIRRHREAIEFAKDYATNKRRQPITVDLVRKLYLILHPEEGDLKTVKYRKDIPQHRLYFHEYAAPDKIAYKVRQVIDWINDPETKKGRNALRIAARAHYDLLRVFPFAVDSGKVARLLMSIIMLRAGLEPAIVHSTERQRYYEALKGSVNTIIHMVQEAEENGLASIEKLLDDHAAKARS